MSDVLCLVRSAGLRALVERAARIADATVYARAGLPEPASLARGGRPRLAVHDFRPDVASSVRWLERLSETPGAPRVFALLTPPVTETLHAVARASPPPRLAGIALAAEIDAGWLAVRLGEGLAVAGRRALAERIGAAWWEVPVLRSLAEREMRSLHPHRTLEGLLRDAGLGRRRFVRAARGAGFHPPLRFLHLLRAIEAATLLREGLTATDTADRLGYGSPSTLRLHLREAFGLPPSGVRRASLDELVRRGRERVGGTRGPRPA